VCVCYCVCVCVWLNTSRHQHRKTGGYHMTDAARRCPTASTGKGDPVAALLQLRAKLQWSVARQWCVENQYSRDFGAVGGAGC
jgi:hypothetical protein